MRTGLTSLGIYVVIAAIVWGIAEFVSAPTMDSPIDRKTQVQFSRVGP